MAWSIVPIVDPIPTVILLIGVIAGLIVQRKTILIFTGTAFLFYLLLGAIQKNSVEEALKEVAASRGHSLVKYDVKPSVALDDLKKFTFFSDGYIAASPVDENFIGDIRFSLLPHRTEPLWGVEIDPANPERHLTFKNRRQMEPNTWQIFRKMICGVPIDENSLLVK